jgi:hypothetical protein
LKKNRQVDPDRSGNRALEACEISSLGTVVHLKGYGMVQVFRMDTPDGDTEYWATDVVTMTWGERKAWADKVWTIEVYHRGLKQFTGVERCSGTECTGPTKSHWLGDSGVCALEHHRIRTGMSWFETKMGNHRSALQMYLSHQSHFGRTRSETFNCVTSNSVIPLFWRVR